MQNPKLVMVILSVVAGFEPATAWTQAAPTTPLGEHWMAPEAEIALARSAAPEKVSARATVKILTPSGFEVAAEGDNGFVCAVLRSFSAAPDRESFYYSKLRAPICFDPIASRTVLPVEELKTKLGLEGMDPDAIAREVAAAYGTGRLPKMEGVAFAYMWSADQDVGPPFGAWHPHMMVYAPYYENSMLGGHELGGPFPFAGEGGPFTVVVIPVDDKLAVKTRSNRRDR